MDCLTWSNNKLDEWFMLLIIQQSEVDFNTVAFNNAREFVKVSLNHDYVYPGVGAASLNEIAFDWRAGTAYISVVFEDDEYYLHVIREDGTVYSSTGSYAEFPFTKFAEKIKHFTDRVNNLNPTWKNLYSV